MAAPDRMHDHEGGYPYTPSEVEYLEEFKCPICLQILKNPHLTECCGQNFCESCIATVKSKTSVCPQCRAKNLTTMRDRKEERKILQLNILCDNVIRGCKWTGPLKSIEEHLKSHCRYRPYSCPYCSLKSTYQEIVEEHYTLCELYPITCPNICMSTAIPRRRLLEHLASCPLEVIPCFYKNLGCKTVLKRIREKDHMKEAAHEHLLLVTQSFTARLADSEKMTLDLKSQVSQLNKEKGKLEKEVNKLTNQIAHLKKGKREIEKEFAQLTKQVNELGILVMPVGLPPTKEGQGLEGQPSPQLAPYSACKEPFSQWRFAIRLKLSLVISVGDAMKVNSQAIAVPISPNLNIQPLSLLDKLNKNSSGQLMAAITGSYKPNQLLPGSAVVFNFAAKDCSFNKIILLIIAKKSLAIHSVKASLSSLEYIDHHNCQSVTFPAVFSLGKKSQETEYIHSVLHSIQTFVPKNEIEIALVLPPSDNTEVLEVINEYFPCPIKAPCIKQTSANSK